MERGGFRTSANNTLTVKLAREIDLTTLVMPTAEINSWEAAMRTRGELVSPLLYIAEQEAIMSTGVEN